LSGPAATRERLIGSTSFTAGSILHLSTHAVADDADPGNSSIFLAPSAGGTRPGRLTAEQISSLSLRADLATLATCESGLGQVSKGEGPMSLARAFLAAGSRSVIVSLWSAPDYSTAQIMTDFYELLMRQGVRRDEALTLAKRKLAKRYDSPFRWAPFVLVGQSGPLAPVR